MTAPAAPEVLAATANGLTLAAALRAVLAAQRCLCETRSGRGPYLPSAGTPPARACSARGRPARPLLTTGTPATPATPPRGRAPPLAPRRQLVSASSLLFRAAPRSARRARTCCSAPHPRSASAQSGR